MKILVDLLFVVPGRNRGTQTYVEGLLAEMSKLPETNLICLTNGSNHRHFRDKLGLSCLRAPIHGRNRSTRLLYELFIAGSVARRVDADALFCPGYLVPIAPNLPTVVVIHDANFHDIPASMAAVVRLAQRLLMPRVARLASRIVTVSQFSKERIVHALRISAQKIDVIHEGPLLADEQARPHDWQDLQRKYGIRGSCFLSISSGLPHKNIERLVRGFIEMKKRRPGDQQLALLGHRLNAETEALLLREGCRDDVIATGFVTDAEKLAFLRNSLIYCFPSLYEGFGLPALEAQSCGLPLAASKCASLPEICGDGAAYFDPLSVNSIAATLVQLYDDPASRERLIRRGYENLSRFSWRKAAIATRRVIAEAAQEH